MRIYVHGNCQASALRWLLSSLDGIEVNSREVHLIDPLNVQDVELYKADISAADIVLTQPIADGYHGVDFLSFNWVKGSARDGATILRFPSIYFRGYALSHYALEMKGHITDYHDVHIADMYCAGFSDEECAAALRSTSFWSSEFVNSEILVSLRSLMIREERFGLDLRCSSFIAGHLNQEVLFHTFNHPSRKTLVHIGNKFLERIGRPPSLSDDGLEFLDQTSMPLYPSLAECLGLQRFARDEVKLPTATFLWGAFVRQVYASYDRLGGRVAVARHLEANGGAKRYLERFRRSRATEATDLASGTQLIVRDLYAEIFGRSPNVVEATYWIDVIKERGIIAAVDQIRASEEAISRNGLKRADPSA